MLAESINAALQTVSGAVKARAYRRGLKYLHEKQWNLIYHASAHTQSGTDATYTGTSMVGWGGGVRWCWCVWGSKNQQCNTGRGGDDSICTLVGGPQVERIQHARAATERRIHRGGEAGKMGEKMEREDHRRAQLQRARPAPDIRGP